MTDVVIYFVLFSCCGWVCESVFCSFLEKKPVNRGFLTGPVCPVYGFGGLIVIYLLGPLRHTWVPLFACGTIACTVLEYATSWVLEKLFQAKWWDYSGNRLNIHGRVCLNFSLLFGALSVIAVKLLYPPFVALVGWVPLVVRRWAAVGMLLALAVDCANTVQSMIQLNGKLAELKNAMDELRQKLEHVQGQHGHIPLAQRIEAYKADHGGRHEAARQSIQQSLSRFERLTGAKQRLQHRRILHAFPHIRSIHYQEQLSKLKEMVELHKKEKK